MPVLEESRIAIVPENFTYGEENTEIANTSLFTWTDGSAKNAYGASLNIGQCIVAVWASGWNACSESGNPHGGAATLRVMY